MGPHHQARKSNAPPANTDGRAPGGGSRRRRPRVEAGVRTRVRPRLARPRYFQKRSFWKVVSVQNSTPRPQHTRPRAPKRQNTAVHQDGRGAAVTGTVVPPSPLAISRARPVAMARPPPLPRWPCHSRLPRGHSPPGCPGCWCRQDGHVTVVTGMVTPRHRCRQDSQATDAASCFGGAVRRDVHAAVAAEATTSPRQDQCAAVATGRTSRCYHWLPQGRRPPGWPGCPAVEMSTPPVLPGCPRRRATSSPGDATTAQGLATPGAQSVGVARPLPLPLPRWSRRRRCRHGSRRRYR